MCENKNKNIIKPTAEEIISLNNIISDYEKKISETEEEANAKKVKIKPEFYHAFKSFKRLQDIETKYGMKVNNILEILKSKAIKISLTNIKKNILKYIKKN